MAIQHQHNNNTNKMSKGSVVLSIASLHCWLIQSDIAFEYLPAVHTGLEITPRIGPKIALGPKVMYPLISIVDSHLYRNKNKTDSGREKTKFYSSRNGYFSWTCHRCCPSEFLAFPLTAMHIKIVWIYLTGETFKGECRLSTRNNKKDHLNLRQAFTVHALWCVLWWQIRPILAINCLLQIE